MSNPIAYLPCPECGEDAIPASDYGKTDTMDTPGPLWSEDDGCRCPNPECDADLRVVVDESGSAYAEARD